MVTWVGPEPNAEESRSRIYVTEVSVPSFDDGVQRLHSRMKEPETEPGDVWVSQGRTVDAVHLASPEAADELYVGITRGIATEAEPELEAGL
jgi:hypothetical protein